MRAQIKTQSHERYYRKVLCNICHCTEGLTKANWFQCSHFGSDSWVEGPPYKRPRPVQHEKFMFPDQLSQGHSRKVVRFKAKAKVAQLSCSWKETRNSCFAEQLRVGVAVGSRQAWVFIQQRSENFVFPDQLVNSKKGRGLWEEMHRPVPRLFLKQLDQVWYLWGRNRRSSVAAEKSCLTAEQLSRRCWSF